MNNIYQITIKKEYAAAVIEDLKLMDAIEILEQPVPVWQQEESLKRLSEYNSKATSSMDEETFFKEIENEDEKVYSKFNDGCKY